MTSELLLLDRPLSLLIGGLQ